MILFPNYTVLLPQRSTERGIEQTDRLSEKAKPPAGRMLGGERSLLEKVHYWWRIKGSSNFSRTG